MKFFFQTSILMITAIGLNLIFTDLSYSQDNENPTKGFFKDNIYLCIQYAPGISLKSEIIDEESGLQWNQIYSDGNILTASPSHSFWDFGLFVEYFVLNHLGIKFGYDKVYLNQEIHLDELLYETIDEKANLINIENPYIGFSLNTMDINSVNLYVEARGGYINGILYPESVVKKLAEYPTTGYRIKGFNIGVGSGVSYYRKNQFYGVSVFYFLDYMATPHQVYYNVKKNFQMTRIIVNLSWGFGL